MRVDVETARAVAALAAVAVAVPGYAIYFRDIYAGRTEPHPVSWALWSAETNTVGAIQVTSGARWGAVPTFTVGIVCAWIAAVGYRRGGPLHATRTNCACAALTAAAWLVWLAADSAALAAVAVVCCNLASYGPTVAKTWARPYTEPPGTYALAGVRGVLALLAVSTYTVATALPRAFDMAAEFAFLVFVLARRARVPAGRVVAAGAQP